MGKKKKDMEQTPAEAEQATPEVSVLNRNADTLTREITWFANVVNKRLHDFFPRDRSGEAVPDVQSPVGGTGYILTDAPVPDLTNDHSVYADLVNYYQLNTDERLLLILALIPYVQPNFLDPFFSVNKALGRGFTEFGGVKGSRHSGFIPTIETAMFLLAGNDLAYRFKLSRLFETDHVLLAHNILQ